MRTISELDEQRPNWLWQFFKGVVTSLLVTAMAIAAISLLVLPPPEPPPVEPERTGPEMISGIEVATTPAYTAAPAAAPEREPEREILRPIELPGPALEVNAVAFDADPAMPLVAVVLDDVAANPLLHPLLFSVEFPLAVGVVVGNDGDLVTARAARAAGFEVVAQLSLARQGQAVGVALEYGLPELEAANRTLALMQRMPMAVAASHPLATLAPPDIPVLRGIAGALSPHGFAYLDHGVPVDGKSAAVAARLAAPVGVSRFVIPASADPTEVIAVLDRAAASAAIHGGAVVYAIAGEQLFLAIQFWASGEIGSKAMLAPLSAVIRRQVGG